MVLACLEAIEQSYPLSMVEPTNSLNEGNLKAVTVAAPRNRSSGKSIVVFTFAHEHVYRQKTTLRSDSLHYRSCLYTK